MHYRLGRDGPESIKADLITKDLTLHPPCAKVLAFVAVLKAQQSSSAMPVVSAELGRTREPLAAFVLSFLPLP